MSGRISVLPASMPDAPSSKKGSILSLVVGLRKVSQNLSASQYTHPQVVLMQRFRKSNRSEWAEKLFFRMDLVSAHIIHFCKFSFKSIWMSVLQYAINLTTVRKSRKIEQMFNLISLLTNNFNHCTFNRNQSGKGSALWIILN